MSATSTAINNEPTSTAINTNTTSTAINTNTPNNKKNPYRIITFVLVAISLFGGAAFVFLHKEFKFKFRKSYFIFVEILILILSLAGVIISFMFQRSSKEMLAQIVIGIMVAIVAFIFLIFNYKPLYDLFYLY